MEERKRLVSEETERRKQAVLNLLLEVMQATSAGYDVAALRYDPYSETVHVDFAGDGGQIHKDGRIINVAMDSDWAMVKDVVKHAEL